MGNIIQLESNMKATTLAKRLREHSGDLSAASKPKPMASKYVLGKKVIFYEDGTHWINNEEELTEEEQFNSELLRFCHASLLVGAPVGDKKRLWVDAGHNPVEIWTHGMPIKKFIDKAMLAIRTNRVSPDFVLDQSLDYSKEEIKNERDVRLFGNSSDSAHIQVSGLDKSNDNSHRIVYYNASRR